MWGTNLQSVFRGGKSKKVSSKKVSASGYAVPRVDIKLTEPGRCVPLLAISQHCLVSETKCSHLLHMYACMLIQPVPKSSYKVKRIQKSCTRMKSLKSPLHNLCRGSLCLDHPRSGGLSSRLWYLVCWREDVLLLL